MSRPSNSQDAGTAVTIYGSTYHLRGSAEADYLNQLGSLVDRRMREVAEATGTADTLKVAILAALNIADEYLQAAGDGGPVREDTGKRVAEMITRLDDALAESL